jgi:hypothetical protein
VNRTLQKHARALKQLLEQLNAHRSSTNTEPLSYTYLAAKLGFTTKGAVSQLLNSSYTANTAAKHLNDLANLLNDECTLAGFEVKTREVLNTPIGRRFDPAQVPANHAMVRVSEIGFFRHKGKHYHYATGAGHVITIREGEEANTVDVLVKANNTVTVYTTVRPIDPSTTQLQVYTSHGLRRTGWDSLRTPRNSAPPRRLSR